MASEGPSRPASPAASPGEGGSRLGASGFVWAASGLAALHAVLGLLVYEPTLFPGGDNAGYLILGDALRSGEGYRDLYLPGSPLHAKYPPLLPSLLAILGVFGGVQLFKVAMLACTSAVVFATARLGRAWIGEGPALFAAGILAVNPTLLEYGHYILSEAPFTLLVVLALWASTRGGRAATALAILAAVGAFATRTAGLTILLALPLAWLARRELGRAAAAGAAAIGALVAWAVYQAWVAPDQPGYLKELVLVDPYDPSAGSVGLAGLVVRAARNLWAYVSGVVPQTAIGAEGPSSVFLTLFGLLIAGLALAGWASRARRGPGPPEVFVLLYAGLIAIWPEVWTDRRFLLPLLPLLVLLAVGFLHDADARIRRWAPALLAVGLALPCAIWILERAPERLACVAAYRSGRPCEAPAQASFYEAARWARENTAEGAVIANRKPSLFYWYGRRQGDLYPYSTDAGAVLAGLERMGADYVVVDQLSGTTFRYLLPAIEEHRARFEPVYQGGSPPTLILRFLPTPSTAQ